MLIKTETKPPFRLSHDRRIFIMAFIAGIRGTTACHRLKRTTPDGSEKLAA